MSKDLPLSGLRILVTRSRHQAGRLSNKLSQFGAETIEIPVIELGPPDSWESLDNALDNIFSFEWILFASVNAVDAFLDRLELFGRSSDELARIKLAAIGPATADALLDRGLRPAFRPNQFIAEALVAQFPGYPHLSHKKILWPRTNVGRSYIADKLSGAGAILEVVPAYKTSIPQDIEGTTLRLVNLLQEKQLDIITLASAQSARNLATLLTGSLQFKNDNNPSMKLLLADVLIATIGPETSQAAIKAIGKANIEAQHYTTTGLVDAIVNYVLNKH